MQDNSYLLNFSNEKIEFNFFGKIGKFGISWRNGQWIITNKRLIFITKVFYPTENRSFHSYTGRSFILIIPLKELISIYRGNDKIVFKYYFNHPWGRRLRKLGIGFFHKDYKNYKVSRRSELINAIQDFLNNKGEKRDIERKRNLSYCPECGTKVEENDFYCNNCGNFLK